MIPRFATLEEAIAQGYRLPVRGVDKDVTLFGFLGQIYQDPDGKRSILVWIDVSHRNNKRRGRFVPMFRPK